MTRKHTVLTVLIALVAITAIPTAFAEIQNNGFGGQILMDAATELENGFTKYKAKMHEIITQVNLNTVAITELQNTSGSGNQEQVDQNSADIQQINGTIFNPYGLEYNIANNAYNIDQNLQYAEGLGLEISINAADITELQNNPTAPTIYLATSSTIIENLDHEGEFGTEHEVIVALCDSGDVVTGGGLYSIRNEQSHSTQPILVDRPLADLSGWEIELYNYQSTYDYTAYAVCMDSTP